MRMLLFRRACTVPHLAAVAGEVLDLSLSVGAAPPAKLDNTLGLP